MNLPSIYRYDNTGSPSVAGNDSTSLVRILRACLVDGYGSQSVSSMTHSTGTVTVTTAAAHKLTSFSRQAIAGANEAGYNGTFIITVTGASAFTYSATGITDASATGTLTTETAPAGWTMPYVNAGEDTAAFRNDTANGTGFFLQVDGAGGADTYTPIIQAYEAMTSETSGTHPFNATTQTFSISTGATADNRSWILVADDRAVYLWCWAALATTPTSTDWLASGLFFGDFVSWQPTDAYAAAFISSGPNGCWGYKRPVTVTVGTFGHGGFCVPRKSDGSAGSVLPALLTGGGPGAEVDYMGQTGVAHSTGGTIIISRPYFNEGALNTIRGVLPGCYYPCHPLAFGQWEIIEAGDHPFLSILTHGRNSTTTSYRVNIFISLLNWR